ncbi:GNAT family N-acetyltransferase [Hydrogenispora ethanolica]|uniref:GNAT family N-acetyltransferase n=1 Tax=Hydrogenispora ethanolica TaxID=1082276 RepID=UPI00140445ED|nr:GNAT family N-acetyltransferase [Hydrogenispora ethanolica]
MLFEYRKATMDEIDVLAQMRVSMLCEGTDYNDEFRCKLYNNTKSFISGGFEGKTFITWVATQNQEIIAMGGLTYYLLPPNDWCPGGKTAYIGNMYTKPAHRRNGIATKLFSLLMDEAKENSCERILLDATCMGRPLYEKYGFKNSNTAMAYYPFGIMSK